uniref:Uncharacterized protein n=2 Tax=Canis lupus familiaris TaxID=9615 RepID=A0A8C0NH39_CANLF
MAVMSSLRAILQASPCKSLWRRFQIPTFMPGRPCSSLLCSFQGLHLLWESMDLVLVGKHQSPINIQWRDSVFDPALKPLTDPGDPGLSPTYSFLMEFEDSTGKSGESRGEAGSL